MKYILYCRKSQESEDRQIQSLDAQERELKDKAYVLGIEVVAIYRESMSAKSVGRPIFNDVIKQIQAGKADAILCWKLDRLARNFIDGGLIIDLLQRGVLKSIQTYEKEYRPSDNVLMMAVELGMTNQYSRDLSVNVKLGNRQKINKGGWPCYAPFGYINNKVDKTLYIDPTDSMFTKKMFGLYSTGLYSLRSLSDTLYNEGLRTKSGRKIYCGRIQRILRNSFYYGIIFYQGKYYIGNHQSLISKDLFDKCQVIMKSGSKPRKQKHFFPLTGLFTCGECGCSITAQKQKTFHYYHCTNGKGTCTQRPLYIREELLEQQLADVFDSVCFDEELIELMYLSALERLESEGAQSGKIILNAQNELSSLKNKEDRLLDAYLSQSIDKTVYEVKQEELKKERMSLVSQITDLETKHQDPRVTIERTKKLFLDSNRAKSQYLEALPERKKEIAFEVLSNALLTDKKMAQPQLKNPYDMLARTPKNAEFSVLCGREESNSHLLVGSQSFYH